MADPKEAFVTVYECRTFVRRAGTGQPVLFLHGAGGLPGWQPFLARLSERYDVLAPDHPGYGQSDSPRWLEEVADLGQFYLEFLKAFDLTGVHVMGHSTARVRSLTAMSSAGIRVKNLGPPDIFAMDPDELVRTLYHDRVLIEQQLNTPPTPEQLATITRNRTTSARLGWNPRATTPSFINRLFSRPDPVPTILPSRTLPLIPVPE